MSPKVKDRIITAIIATASGSMVAILAFWLNTSDVNARDLQKEIDSKLDKKDFTEYKSSHKKEHDKDREDVLYIRQKIDDIYDYLLNKK